MKICGIYLIKSPSGKVYIGQSVDIKRRFKRYRLFGAKEQPALHRSILKYGFEKHHVSILAECERGELNTMESEFIKKYNSFNSKIGLNLTSGGGQNWVISEETRMKMKLRPRKKHSQETKEKMRLSALGKNKGKPSPRKGVKLSEQTKNKIKANHAHSRPWTGRKHTDEAKYKMSKKRTGMPSSCRKPVIDTATGIIYSHKKEAAEAIGIKVRTLKAYLCGNLKNKTSIRYL